MAKFYVGGEFPSFMPIRTTAAKILTLIDAKIAIVVNGRDKAFLESLKIRAQQADPAKLFYFTIEQAKLVGLV